ncbi:hypothetical protein OUZ56_026084 [Daphnia magna]|uniref:Uncharacterized protein n=1 Tax=Daphnia magna TaxID=35525 RepID=A0ABQ9ZKQ7_9CRUS|nr:hypothetical protein OUZ56_026084 [Daphnia magna]
MYAVYFTLLEIKRFARHTCSIWEVTTMVYKDFLQWNQVSLSRKPIKVDEAMCHRTRDLRQCRGKAMDIIGCNTFALEGYPFVGITWLQTTTEKMTNCRLEEVTLQTECPNYTISSPPCHTQYIRDFARDISNHLAREIRNLQCESRRAAYHAATTMAQYDSWLAASHLDLSLCTKLLAVGASVSVMQCSSQNDTFETVFTPCGTQPKIGNQTMYVEDWELTKLQTFLLPSTDDRQDQNGGQAAWIPNPDEEDILYCADYSSDMKKFLCVTAYPDDDEDILYCADNPYDDEVMYFFSTHNSLGSDEEDLATACYVERTYSIPSQRDREYRCYTLEWEGSAHNPQDGVFFNRGTTSMLACSQQP